MTKAQINVYVDMLCFLLYAACFDDPQLRDSVHCFLVAGNIFHVIKNGCKREDLVERVKGIRTEAQSFIDMDKETAEKYAEAVKSVVLDNLTPEALEVLNA